MMTKFSDVDKFIDWILDLMTGNEANLYKDARLTDNTWIRTFDPATTVSSEYVWHRDKKDRIVTVLEGEGWQFQFDEQIPEMINSGDRLVIDKGVYHRLIIGKTRLKLKIEEKD